VDEKTLASPVLDYGRIKLDTEHKLAEIAASSKIAFSAIRLPHTYGAMDLYFQQLRKGLLVLPGLGSNVFTHLHVTDAAELLIACALMGFRGITPVGDDLPASWTEFLNLVKKYHVGARVMVLPRWLALAAAYAISPVRRFRPYPGLETPGAVRSYNCNISVKPGLLSKDLGYSLLFPTIHEGVPAVVNESIRLQRLITR
jgi:nucleoside-diphosphate-sugar epimerase